MTPAWFLQTRQPHWDRLDALIRKAGRRGAAALTESELHELTRLYPAVAVDVARSRMYRLDAATQRRVNQLAIAAHGMLYRRRHVSVAGAVWRFYSRDYPRLFRRLWPYAVLATALFLAGTLGSYVTVRLRPAAAYLFVPEGLDMPKEESGVTAEDVSERFRRMPKPPMATAIMGNNISVAFHAFALGITAGVGTCYVLFMNAMMLGAFFGHFDNHALTYACWSYIAPHGILEIMAVLISGAAGLRLGLSLAVPGRLTRGASLRVGAREAVLLVLGTIPMFVLAGAIEGFVTPSFLPGAAKIALGLLVGAAALTYLLLVGRQVHV
jgi:uncharacterized membrane protein SpoIIM required for sporulation